MIPGSSRVLPMKYTDIAIIGGGLAGSTAAAMLGRAGVATVADRSSSGYPPGLRCEKLSGHEQLERFRQTGLAEATLRAATHDGENWIARFGYLLDKRPSEQYGIMYDALVNAVRAEIPAEVETDLRQGRRDFDQRRTAKDHLVERRGNLRAAGGAGQRLERRPAPQARHSSAQIVSACHSITLGFDIEPVGRAAFDFPPSPISRSGRATGFPT